MVSLGYSTCYGVLNNAVVQVLTHPLLAALPWQLDVLGVRAVWARQADVHGAQRHTGHPSTLAATLGVTGRLEDLSILVGDPVELTGQIFLT